MWQELHFSLYIQTPQTITDILWKLGRCQHTSALYKLKQTYLIAAADNSLILLVLCTKQSDVIAPADNSLMAMSTTFSIFPSDTTKQASGEAVVLERLRLCWTQLWTLKGGLLHSQELY
jgi:hypothetical protein